MSLVKKNIFANFIGSIWAALMGFVFLPIYIKYIGLEAYGLIGLYSTILALSSLLDMGLSTTLNRELARLSVNKENTEEMRDMVRTLEIPYWLIGFIIFITVISLSSQIAYKWVNLKHMTAQSVQIVICIMGLLVAFQWPISFYSGGLMGLQKQLPLNIINILMSSLRGLGGVFILWKISGTIEAYFYWQIFISGINVIMIGGYLWGCLSVIKNKPLFKYDILKKLWKFAAGMTGISVLGTILMQMDKVVLSKMISLEKFGYYSLSSVVGMNMYKVIMPVYSAVYPRFTSLIALKKNNEIIILYHKSSQLISVLVFSLSMVFLFFSKEILFLWTGDYATVANTYMIANYIIIGTVLNGLMNMPSALQLAYGKTRLLLIINIISIFIFLPFMIFLVRLYGGIGAAYIWVALNSFYFLIIPFIMHIDLLCGEMKKWYVNDILKPFLGALIVSVIGRKMYHPEWSSVIVVNYIIFILFLALLVSVILAKNIRYVFMVKLRVFYRDNILKFKGRL